MSPRSPKEIILHELGSNGHAELVIKVAMVLGVAATVAARTGDRVYTGGIVHQLRPGEVDLQIKGTPEEIDMLKRNVYAIEAVEPTKLPPIEI